MQNERWDGAAQDLSRSRLRQPCHRDPGGYPSSAHVTRVVLGRLFSLLRRLCFLATWCSWRGGHFRSGGGTCFGPRPSPVDCFLERPAERENDQHEHNAHHDDLPLRNRASRAHARCYPDAGRRGEPVHVMAFLASEPAPRKPTPVTMPWITRLSSVPVAAWTGPPSRGPGE